MQTALWRRRRRKRKRRTCRLHCGGEEEEEEGGRRRRRLWPCVFPGSEQQHLVVIEDTAALDGCFPLAG